MWQILDLVPPKPEPIGENRIYCFTCGLPPASSSSFQRRAPCWCRVCDPLPPQNDPVCPEAPAGRLLHLDTMIHGPALRAPSDRQARTRPQAARSGASPRQRAPQDPCPAPQSVIPAPRDASRRKERSKRRERRPHSPAVSPLPGHRTRRGPEGAQGLLGRAVKLDAARKVGPSGRARGRAVLIGWRYMRTP